MPPSFDPTQPQPYQAPIQGYSWAGQPPQSLNPFVTAGTSMIQDYAMMRQQEQVRQYQQMMSTLPQMSPWMQAAVAYTPQYNFGVVGGQFNTWSEVQRQTQLSAGAFATMGTAIGGSLPLFNVADAVVNPMLTRAGLSTASGAAKLLRFGIGGAAGMALTYPIQTIAERGIERARWSADIERDVKAYSARWTGGAGFGRSETRSLGRDLMSSMHDNQDFFRPQDQLKINKMGLASGMLKGRSTEEYKRNFEELKSNVKDVVQLMNTTVEGGLSVMKELQGAGFNSPTAIRSQVMQAKAWGAVSGVGTQNMLSLGAAGAQATMGTGWSAAAGANMYQGSATVISQMALQSPHIANAVRGMGGISNAGAATANAMMNVMKSGMGVQTMAYLMDPVSKGIDAKRASALVEGRVGPMDIIAGANRFGMAGGRGGANNRVLFEKYANRNWNGMSLMQQAASVRSIYEQWASTRGGVDEASSFVFSKMFTSTPEQAEIFSDILMNPGQMINLAAGKDMNEYMLRAANRTSKNQLTTNLRNNLHAFNVGISATGDSWYRGGSYAAGFIGNQFRKGVNKFWGKVDPSGMWIDRAKLNPTQASANRMYGSASMSSSDLARVRNAIAQQGSDALSTNKDMSFDKSLDKIIGRLSSKELNTLTEQWAQANIEEKNPADISSVFNAMDLKNNPDLVLKLADRNASRAIYNSLNGKILKGNSEYQEGAKTLAQWRDGGTKDKLQLMKDIELDLNKKIHSGDSSAQDRHSFIQNHPLLKGNKQLISAAKSYTGVAKDVTTPNIQFGATGVSGKQYEQAKERLRSSNKTWIGLGGKTAFKRAVRDFTPQGFIQYGRAQEVNYRDLTLPESIKSKEEEFKLAIAGKTGAQIIDKAREFGASGEEIQSMNIPAWATTANDMTFQGDAVIVKRYENEKLIEQAKARKQYLLNRIPEEQRASAGAEIDKLLTNPNGANLTTLGNSFSTLLGGHNFKNADKAANAVFGAIEKEYKNSSNDAIEKILNAMKDELVKANENYNKDVDKDGKPLTAKDKELAKKELQDLAVKTKNLSQETAAAATSQDSQTAAPNILNYWNNKWMM